MDAFSVVLLAGEFLVAPLSELPSGRVIKPWFLVKSMEFKLKERKSPFGEYRTFEQALEDIRSMPDKPQNPETKVFDEGEFLRLENLVCTDADGNIFERYGALKVRKDIFRTDEVDENGNKQPRDFTPYEAIVHCEEQSLFLPSFALNCNILAALDQRKEEPEVAKVLGQYKDYGPGYGWHAQNTLVHWGTQEVIHYPQDSDFPKSGGQNRINSAKPRKSLRFNNAGFPNSTLKAALGNSEYLRFLKNLSGLSDPSILVKIGEYFQKEARVWVSSSNEIRAAWLGCDDNDFDLVACNNLDYDYAARGVREA